MTYLFHNNNQMSCFQSPYSNLNIFIKAKKGWIWPIWETRFSLQLCRIAKPASSIISQVIILIFAPVLRRAVKLKSYASLTLRFDNLIEYYKWEFRVSTELDSKILTQNCIVLSSIVAFIGCFLIASAEASNSPIVKFTARSRIRLVIIIDLTDFFNTLTTHGYFFLLVVFLGSQASASAITDFWERLEIKTRAEVGASIKLSFMSSHSPNHSFFSTISVFSFSMRRHNICLTGSLEKPWASFGWLFRVANTPISICSSKNKNWASLSKK